MSLSATYPSTFQWTSLFSDRETLIPSFWIYIYLHALILGALKRLKKKVCPNSSVSCREIGLLPNAWVAQGRWKEQTGIITRCQQ